MDHLLHHFKTVPQMSHSMFKVAPFLGGSQSISVCQTGTGKTRIPVFSFTNLVYHSPPNKSHLMCSYQNLFFPPISPTIIKTEPFTIHHSLSLSLSSLKSMSAAISSVPRYVGLKPRPSTPFPAKESVAWAKKTVSKGSRIRCMKTWNPIDNKKFETLSYLPPLSEESIAKEVDYMIKKEWIPCLEFDAVGHVYRENSRMPGYYDGRYWTLWKLPMFGCNDSSQVLNEIQECKKAYPNAYIRCLAFDNKRQVQCMAFVVQKPAAAATTAA